MIVHIEATDPVTGNKTLVPTELDALAGGGGEAPDPGDGPHYCAWADVRALIPEAWLTEALDDDSDPAATPERLTDVLAMADLEINAALEVRYAVPVTIGTNFLKVTAAYIAAALCYTRRNVEVPESLLLVLRPARDRLAAIADGTQPLTSTATAVLTRTVAIGARARMNRNVR